MAGVVPAAVGKVEAAHECDVPRRIVTVADDEELLVMGPEHAYPLIQQHLSAGLVDFTAVELV
ncbi:hypothetical protein [Pseudarthrobacter sp. TAF60_1]|uniref:hypothetical protein n=1 Tax=Pseudarthrobacter sp. TAF60_1 TaxID=3233071 RepID=UPI003F9AC5F7